MSSYIIACKHCGQKIATSIEELEDAEEDGFVCRHCKGKHKIEVNVSIEKWGD